MKIIRHPRGTGPETAIAIGSFDGVHRGHAAIFERLRLVSASRSLASAVLTFEPLPRELFAPQSAPARITALHEKLALLAEQAVSTTFVQRFDRAFAALEPSAFAEKLRREFGARHVLVGEDFRFGAGRAGDVRALSRLGEALGFSVDVVAAVQEGGERISSTSVRAALAAGDFEVAERLLGRTYAIRGRVRHGAKRGRALGFPTANVALHRKKPALNGIFAVKCFGAATRGLEGVASLGYNPAVTDGGPASLEAYLFDFQGDLYGRRLSVEFHRKLRDEAPFASLDELAAQIRRDCEAAREFFRATGN